MVARPPSSLFISVSNFLLKWQFESGVGSVVLQDDDASTMSLVHYHDSESEDDDSVATPVDKIPPGVGEDST